MKAQLTGRKYNKGFVTLEILIAFAVLILCMGAVIMVVFGNQSIAVDLETNNEAISKAQALLEKARADSRFDFNLVNSTHQNPAVGSCPPDYISDDIYCKKIDVTQTDLFTKKVTSTATWQTGGRVLSTIFTTILTNPDAVNGGDTCSSELMGDWTNPQKTEYEFGADILSNTSSGFPITSVQSFEHKLYVTVSNQNGNNDETFFILDITDPTSTPQIIGKLDNSPGTISEGLNAVAVDGEKYAYVANAYDSSPQGCIENHNCAQLQVIDFSNSASPFIAKNLKISSFTTGNKLANGVSIFYKNGIVYLGLANATSGAEFYILDVGGLGVGTPTNPVILSNIEIGNGVNAIFVRNNYAYITSPNSQELKIFNITNLSSPVPAGNFNATTGAGNGKSIILVGNKLYLGKTVPNAGNDFHILNNSNSNITLPELGGINSSSSINGIIVRNYLAFLITSNGQFQTWKIDNPSTITQYASPLTLPPGGGGSLQGTATDCEGNYMYVGSKNSNNKGYISVITSS